MVLTLKELNKMNKIVLVLSFLFSGVCFSEVPDLKTKNEVIDFTAEVMNFVAKGQTLEALKKLKPYSIVPSHEFEVMLDQFKLQEPMIEQRFGKTVGTELISIKEQGDSLLLIIYLQKFEMHVMSWRMYYYKPTNKWQLNSYYNDSGIQEIFAY